MNIIQSGLTEYWTRIHIDHTPCRAGAIPSAVERSLTVEDTFYLFVTLAVGLTVCTLSFFSEFGYVVFHRLRKT